MAIQEKENPLIARRRFRAPILGLVLLAFIPSVGLTAQPEEEEEEVSREFPLGEPQFFLDSYWIRKRANEEGSAKAVPFIFHSPQFRSELLLAADQPWEASGVGYFSVLHDPVENKYRLFYEVENPLAGEAGFPDSHYLIAYAESKDGLQWSKPALGLVPWGERANTNLVVAGEVEARFPHVHVRPAIERPGPRNLGELPKGAFRGGRFLMTYRDDRQRFATSEDGIRWTEDGEGMLRYRTESYLTLSRDRETKTYAAFLLAGIVQESPGPVGRRGFGRWVARLSSPGLQIFWDRRIEPGRMPGKAETGRIESLKAFRCGGLYWGLAERFNEDTSRLEVELTTSREGLDWSLPKTRPTLIPAGSPSVWNARRVIAADRIVEDGEDWRLYYSVSGAEGVWQSGFGMATFSAERVISVRADETGMTSYLETQPMIWPGGRLWLNADASGGSIETRVKKFGGSALPGFSYEESIPIRADGRRLRVEWKTRDLNELKNEAIQFEFRFTNADLFAFLAER